MNDPIRVVEEGYDAIAPGYRQWRAAISGSPDDEWLGDLLTKLPSPADVLELGCGPAEWATRILEAGHHYSGIDISEEQLRGARDRVPGAKFLQADLTELDFEPGSFHAVISIYVFGHVPRVELPGVLERIGRWLRPGGWLLATFARSGWEGVDEDFLGVPMFFGSYTDDETLDLLRAAGFHVERAKVVPILEPEGEASFLWVSATTRGRAARSP